MVDIQETLDKLNTAPGVQRMIAPERQLLENAIEHLLAACNSTSASTRLTRYKMAKEALAKIGRI